MGKWLVLMGKRVVVMEKRGNVEGKVLMGKRVVLMGRRENDGRERNC